MLKKFLDHKVVFHIFLAYFAILAWPLCQFMFGSDVSNHIGGNFWITSNGPLDTLSKAVNIFSLAGFVFDKVVTRSAVADGIIVAVCIVLLAACYTYFVTHKENFFQSDHEFQIFQKLSFLLGGTLLSVGLLDLHTPVSTTRNFIILLPIVAALLGVAMSIVANITWARTASVLFVAAFGILSLYASYNKMQDKWAPLQNWRAAAEFIVYKIEKENVSWKLFYMEPKAELIKSHDLISNYYIDRMHLHLAAKPLFMSDIERISEPFILFVGHLIGDERRDEVLRSVRTFHKNCELHSPQQHWAGTVIVLACRD